MSLKKPLGDPNILGRRIVANPRYSDVGPTVDSGVTTNVVKYLKETEVSVKQGRDELFRRMRPSALAHHISERLATQQQQEQRAVAGHSGSDAATAAMYPIPSAPRKEILLLDVREKEDYDRGHIASSLNYPWVRLSQSMNHFTPEIYAFLRGRDRENRYIVLVDLEEDIVVGRHIGNIFIERGGENVLILSGGLRQFVQDHSDLIVGEPPVPIEPKNPRRHHSARTGATDASMCSRSTLGTSVATSHKPKSLTSSLARRAASSAGGWR